MTNFPASLDSFPSAATLAAQTLAAGPHSGLHGNLGDAVAALEAKVGTDGSAVASSLDHLLGLKAPLDSPAFTGTPSAPTAAPGTNTTRLATTAFVIANQGAGAVSSFNTRTGAVTLTAADVQGALAGGQLLAPDGTGGAPAFSFASEPQSGLYRASTSTLRMVVNGTNCVAFTSLGMFASAGLYLGDQGDLFVGRDAPGVRAQRNGTSPQASLLYGTYTDVNTGEWVETRTQAAAPTLLRTQRNGTGTLRGLQVQDTAASPLGFWGATPAVRSAGWSAANHTDAKTLDEAGATLGQLANVVGTLLNALKTYGLLGA